MFVLLVLNDFYLIELGQK